MVFFLIYRFYLYKLFTKAIFILVINRYFYLSAYPALELPGGEMHAGGLYYCRSASGFQSGKEAFSDCRAPGRKQRAILIGSMLKIAGLQFSSSSCAQLVSENFHRQKCRLRHRWPDSAILEILYDSNAPEGHFLQR